MTRVGEEDVKSYTSLKPVGVHLEDSSECTGWKPLGVHMEDSSEYTAWKPAIRRRGRLRALGLLSRDNGSDSQGLPVHSLASDPKRGHVWLKSFVDSGAARSVCPVNFGSHFGLNPTDESRNGEGFRTADGSRVRNHGGRMIKGTNVEGRATAMKYSVSDVSVALDSVNQICDAGATVVFHKSGGYIKRPCGTRTSFKRVGDTYARFVCVPVCAEPDVTPPEKNTRADEPRTQEGKRTEELEAWNVSAHGRTQPAPVFGRPRMHLS